MRALCIGISVYDLTLSLSEPFIENHKMRVQDTYENCGGQATCAACTLGKWGEEVSMISRVGKDTYGKRIMDSLRSFHVDTSHMQMLTDYQTSFSVILNHQNNGHRSILNHQDQRCDVKFSLPEAVDVILLDGHEEEISMQALQRFPHAITVIDAEKCSPLTLKLARQMDYIVCSEDFAAQYSNLNSKEETNWEAIFYKVKELNQKHVVITLGERGLLYEEAGNMHHMEAFSVPVIDTTGAGDIFHGAFVYGLMHHMEYQELLRFASMASALSIQKPGGVTSIPERIEVLEALSQRENE